TVREHFSFVYSLGHRNAHCRCVRAAASQISKNSAIASDAESRGATHRKARCPTMKKPLQPAVLERRLVCDGAMGTQLMLAALEQGNCGEMWNVTHPERVL